jgi:hypothetical protein
MLLLDDQVQDAGQEQPLLAVVLDFDELANGAQLVLCV